MKKCKIFPILIILIYQSCTISNSLFKTSKISIDFDTVNYSFTKFDFFKIGDNSFGFVGNKKIYYLNQGYVKVDSMNLRFITHVDGFKYDSKNKIVVVWQKNKGIYESYFIPNFKRCTSLILNNNNIKDMNYHFKMGFVFTLTGYYKDSCALKLYPLVLKGQNTNEMYEKYERSFMCGNCSKIKIIDNNKIILSCENGDESVFEPNFNKKR